MSKKQTELTPEVVELIDKVLVDRFEAARALPVSEVARLFGVNEKTVRRLIDAADLPHVRIRGRICVMQADAVGYLTRNRHGAAAS